VKKKKNNIHKIGLFSTDCLQSAQKSGLEGLHRVKDGLTIRFTEVSRGLSTING
jgi:hypothetical protein